MKMCVWAEKNASSIFVCVCNYGYPLFWSIFGASRICLECLSLIFFTRGAPFLGLFGLHAFDRIPHSKLCFFSQFPFSIYFHYKICDAIHFFSLPRHSVFGDFALSLFQFPALASKACLMFFSLTTETTFLHLFAAFKHFN